ncbi:hypothetical protein ABTQ05_20600, partial [Acinetobacter baumannii]
EGHPQAAKDLYVSPGTIEKKGANAETESEAYVNEHGNKACVAKETSDFSAADQPGSKVNGDYLKVQQYVADVHLEPGNSGGPAFDAQ